MAYKPPLLPYVDFRSSEPPALPIRQADDPGGPEYVTKAEIVAEGERGLVLRGTTQTGENMRIAVNVMAPGIVRVLLEEENPDPQRITLAHPPSGDEPFAVSLERSEGRVTLVSDLVRVRIDLEPFQITFYGPDGRALLEQSSADRYAATGRLAVLPFGFSRVAGQRIAFHDTFNAEPDEHFYGFGEKFTGFDKRGQRVEMWHYNALGVHTERAYKNVPFFVSTRGYGIFVDSVTAINFDLAVSNHATFSLIVPDTALDYYVIVGPDPKSIIARYASLVAFPILPPKWAFGLWVSSGFQRDTADAVLERARQLREQGIPCDVLHLDSYWQRDDSWSGLDWDEELFPDPESLIRQVKALGFKVSLWMNPYLMIGSKRFAEARQKGYLLKMPQGETFVGRLWGSESRVPVGIIDMTNPEAVAWLKGLLRRLLRIGVDVFKTDFGEGIPVGVVAHNGMTGERLHNLYPLLYNDLVSEVTAEETGRAGLVWARSSYAGGQRHAAQWAGDPKATYQAMASTLRGGLSIGMCGHAFWSHDIGGFFGQPTPDLYVRWAQFGLFSPLSRAHGVTTRLPWDYGEEVLRIFRDYTRIRYRLLPYIYTYACIAAETSLPLLRAMVLEFPDDPNTYTMDLQYIFGAELMVAPVYNSDGRRPVYFPAGRWVDFWTHEVIEGPQTRWVEVPLDVLPLYVRGNALIPTIEPPDYPTDAPFDLVTFDGYLFDHGSFALHDTDGITRVSAWLEDSRLNIQLDGVKQRLRFRLIPLRGAPSVDTVHVNGLALSRVDMLEIGPGAAAGWKGNEDGTIWVMIESEGREP